MSSDPEASPDYLYELIASAFAKFRAAGLSVDQARFGLFGIWVVDGDVPGSSSAEQIDRALASCAAWAEMCADRANPYADLVRFYASGASLGRWENRILDIYGSRGEKLWGVPLKSLIEAADKR